MDPEAPWRVLAGVAAVSSVGALTGAGVGFIKRDPPLLYGLATGINTGMASFVFFASREYLVSPLMMKFGTAKPPFSPQASSESVLPTGLSDKLIDTAAAGALTGACLNGYRYGPRRIASGALAFSLATAVLQLGYNELAIARIKYVSRHTPQQIAQSADQSATSRHNPSFDTKSDLPSPNTGSRDFSERIMNVMTWIAPVKRLSDEEYVEVMRKQQEQVDKRLGQLSQELGDNRDQSNKEEE